MARTAKGTRRTAAKRTKRAPAQGQIHIHASFNNTIVTVTDLSNQQPEAFTVLGAWDSDPDKGIISYLTPVAQAILTRKVSEEIEVEMDGAPRRLRIDSIIPYKTA